MDILDHDLFNSIQPLLETFTDFNTGQHDNANLDEFLIDVVYNETRTFKLNVINLICHDIYNSGLLGTNKTPIYLLPKYINDFSLNYLVDNVASSYIERAKKSYIVTEEDAELFDTIFVYDTEDYIINYFSNTHNKIPKTYQIKKFLERRTNKFNLWLLKRYNKFDTLPNEIEGHIKSYL